MKISKKSLPNSRIQLTITATADQYQHALEHEFEHLAAETAIPGFRKGKAPKAKLIERIGRPRLEAGALDHLISHAYYEALQQENIVPTEGPEVKVEKFQAAAETDPADTEVLTFTAEVDVIPAVKVDGYQKIKIKKPAEPKIEAEEVEKVIDYLRKQRASLVEVEPGCALEKDMWADIGYEGSVDGVKRADMANQNHPLVIGEGQLIPGFEEQLIGMKKGEERVIQVKFPKDYNASELAGKKAEFTVTLHELKRVVLPEKDAVFAAEYGHPSFEELERAIKENIQLEKEQESKQKTEEDVLEQLVKVAKFEVPGSLVEQELERMFQDAKERLEKMNFNWDTYLEQVKKTAEEAREEMRPQAERNVRIGLALGGVMDAEGLRNEENAGQLAMAKLMEIATK